MRIQWHLVHSQCCITTTSIYLSSSQLFPIPPNKTPYPLNSFSLSLSIPSPRKPPACLFSLELSILDILYTYIFFSNEVYSLVLLEVRSLKENVLEGREIGMTTNSFLSCPLSFSVTHILPPITGPSHMHSAKLLPRAAPERSGQG